MLLGGLEKGGFVSGEDMVSIDFSVGGQSFVFENVNILQLVFPFFQAQHFGDGGDFARAIMQPRGLDDNMNGGGNLFAEGGKRNFNAAKQRAGFQAQKAVAGAVGMDGG